MREILFRAKRIDNWEWIEGTYEFAMSDISTKLIGLQKGENHWIIESNGNMHLIDQSTICQYTGKTDCNDKKVWENDILQVSDEDTFIYRVFWDSEDCMFKLECYDHICTFADCWMGDLEVIGNIFDNPELLKGGAE